MTKEMKKKKTGRSLRHHAGNEGGRNRQTYENEKKKSRIIKHVHTTRRG